MCVLFAATYPERTRALALYGTYAKRRDPDDDYPWAPTCGRRGSRTRSELEETWGENVDISTMSPSADEAMAPGTQRRGRAALSPAAARDLILMNSKVGRPRRARRASSARRSSSTASGDRDSRPDEGRYIARPDPRRALRRAERRRPRARGRPGSRSSTRSRSSSPACVPRRRRTACSRPCSSPTSSARRSSAPSARRRGLGVAARVAQRGRPARARALLRRGDRHGGRRVPRGLRRPGARDSLRSRDPRRPSASSGSRCGPACTPARSSGGRATKPRGIAVHVGARVMSLGGAGEVLVELDDARPRRGLGPRVRGPGRARAEGDRGRAPRFAAL